jgi:hypothetical protein
MGRKEPNVFHAHSGGDIHLDGQEHVAHLSRFKFANEHIILFTNDHSSDSSMEDFLGGGLAIYVGLDGYTRAYREEGWKAKTT